MSGNAYGHPWKYMVKRSKKAFKSSTKSSLHLKENQKNQKEFEKNDKVLGDIIKN